MAMQRHLRSHGSKQSKPVLLLLYIHIGPLNYEPIFSPIHHLGSGLREVKSGKYVR